MGSTKHTQGTAHKASQHVKASIPSYNGTGK
jgi:hypothetical protein